MVKVTNPGCCGDVINNAKKFTFYTSKRVKYLKNIICRGYNLTTIVYSVRQL